MHSEIKLHQVLKFELEKRDLSQKDLVSKARIGQSTLHGYLNGVIPKGLITLIKVSQFLDVSVDELIFGKNFSDKGKKICA